MLRPLSWQFGIRGKRAVGLAVGLFCASFSLYQLCLAQDGGLKVNATCGDFDLNPVTLADTAKAPLSASMSNLPDPGECALNPPSWTWEVGTLQYSPDGTTWGGAPGGGYAWITEMSSASPDATVNFSFCDNDNDGGYWKIPCDASVTFTDTCADPYGASGSVDAQVKALTIVVLRKLDGGKDYEKIEDAKNNVTLLVGQFVNLQAKVMPDGEPGTYQWKNPPGTTFYDYAALTGTLTKLPAAPPAPDPDGLLTSSKLWFYWADAADNRDVVCTFTPKVGKAPPPATGTLSVIQPTVNPAFKSKQGLTALDTGPIYMGLLKGPATVTEGMEFSATVSVPAPFAAGQWQFVQTLVPARTFRDAAGVGYHPDQNGQTVLDMAVPYPYQNNVNTLAATLKVTAVDGAGAITGIAVANGGSYTFAPANPVAVTPAGATFNLTILPAPSATSTGAVTAAAIVNAGKGYAKDQILTVVGGVGPAGPFATGNPGTAADSPLSPLAPWTMLKVNGESFKMYIMFMPPGASSRWVPLQYSPWTWTGTATLAKGVWGLAGQGQTNPAVVPTAAHPTWTANFANGITVKD